ncbi:hypothetical protein CVT25_013057 [Psilocybe cyanescens]|uniref:Uncharacterized protein n=1 Tax=Psilocybe cyanescens TaxID=93625 RepID=A0A409XSM6_PSICY|nr:hypothetical protein CVT25_013057 [Psilocybe cyanescens]
MGKKNKPQKGKGKPPKPSIKIPATPSSATKGRSATTEDKNSTSVDSRSNMASPFHTPPTSPSTPATEQKQEKGPTPALSTNDVASNDILAIANVLATMKSALVSMSDAFDRLEDQTEKMVSLTLDIKAADQLRQLRSALEDHITRHKVEIESLRVSLKTKITEAVEEKIRSRLFDMVRATIQERIEEKVRHQIPEDLRQQVISHKRQILQVKTNLHNSEARQYNSLQTVPGPHARLRPLLRPLPTPEQSPVILISRSSSLGDSTLATPTTTFPQAPAPTPIKRVTSSSLRSALLPETVPPTPSRLFPRDLTALFALSQDEARRLLREYGLDSATSSPVRETIRPRGLSIVNEEGSDTLHDEKSDLTEGSDAHAKDMNKFMAHIGVPYLMIPAPKEKFDQSAPLSSRSRRKLLTPLIIK